MGQQNAKKALRPMTVLLDADLERALHDERERLGRETGIRASMNQVATSIMRAGFQARQA